jgi:DNA polymerase elongation subunit (family B)
MNKGYKNALLLVTKAIDKIMLGGEAVTKEDLVISKLLGQDLVKYRSLFPHLSAAFPLSNENKHPSKGDNIKYTQTRSIKILFAGLYQETLLMGRKKVATKKNIKK